MKCSMCLYVIKNKTVEDAITVVNGNATCYDHMGYFINPSFRTAVEIVKESRK